MNIAALIRKSIIDGIESHGHSVVGVMGDPPFSYTVGLYPDFGFEIILCLVPPHFATQIINDIVAEMHTGFDLRTCTVYRKWLANDVPSKFAFCDPVKIREYVVQADAYFGVEVPVLQMLVSDKQGNLPGDADYAKGHLAEIQPLLFANLH